VDFDSITNFLIVSALKCINEAKEAKDLNTSIGTLRNRTSLHARPYALQAFGYLSIIPAFHNSHRPGDQQISDGLDNSVWYCLRLRKFVLLYTNIKMMECGNAWQLLQSRCFRLCNFRAHYIK